MAARVDRDQIRTNRLGAIGICPKGKYHRSRNISTHILIPSAHAEARLIKKLPQNSFVFVARACKNGNIGMAHPCKSCMIKLKNARVARVYYTIDSENYGIIPFR